MEAVKDFIYLDTDYLQSYVAQIDGGLLSKRGFEKEDEKSEETEQNLSRSKDGTPVSWDFGALKGGFSKSSQGEYENFKKTASEVGRQLLDYEMHDNIYNMFFGHADVVEVPFVGKYISITDEYVFFDLSFSENLYSGTIRNNKVFRMSVGASLTRGLEDDDKQETDIDQWIDNNKDIIEIMIKFLPSDTFILIRNCIVPIKTKCLRESLREIKFKYSGKLTLVGKVTSLFSGTDHLKQQKFWSGMVGEINDLDRLVFSILNQYVSPDNSIKYIVSPIALYL
jgi:hypothetical protein